MLLRHVHLKLWVPHRCLRTIQNEYYTCMKDMINKDMREIFGLYKEVYGHSHVCIQGGRCIEMDGANVVRPMKGHRKTGAVVYFWDVTNSISKDPRGLQVALVKIQKQVIDDQQIIINEMMASDKTLQ